METQIQLGDITVDVVLKDIKNIHLSVYPPNGRVRISAPSRMDIDSIRIYAISKLDWIKKQQKKQLEQERETKREYLDLESHYVWGKRFLLEVSEVNKPPSVEVLHNKILLKVRPGAGEEKKRETIEKWYRKQLKAAVPPLIAEWEQKLGVNVERLFVQKMKTRWGSCNNKKNSIRLNTELAKKTKECLEYIVVHEMTHLIEPTHNHRFIALMDYHLPHWKQLRDELNRMPLGHVDWKY